MERFDPHRTAGARLRQAREACGETQADVAGATGLTEAQVAAFENGEEAVPLDRLLRLALHLQVSPWWLAGWSGRDTPPRSGVEEPAADFATAQDEALLEAYRELDAGSKRQVLRLALDRAQAGSPRSATASVEPASVEPAGGLL